MAIIEPWRKTADIKINYGRGMPEGNAYHLPGPLFCFGLSCFSIVETSFLDLALSFPRLFPTCLFTLNILRYFIECAYCVCNM